MRLNELLTGEPLWCRCSWRRESSLYTQETVGPFDKVLARQYGKQRDSPSCLFLFCYLSIPAGCFHHSWYTTLPWRGLPAPNVCILQKDHLLLNEIPAVKIYSRVPLVRMLTKSLDHCLCCSKQVALIHPQSPTASLPVAFPTRPHMVVSTLDHMSNNNQKFRSLHSERSRSLDSLSSTISAAAAKSLQSCPTLCDPRDGSPPGSPISGILQARTLEWVAISFSNASKCKVKVKSLSYVRLLATPWTAAYQAPPMGFSRQEYWSGVPLPSPTTISK